MSLYRFSVHDSGDRWRIEDEPPGTELPDEDAARHEAMEVVRDLRKNTHVWDPWSISVRQGDRLVWTTAFADVP